MDNVIDPIQCKIVIDIEKSGNWNVNINGKDVILPSRFMIDLRDGKEAPKYTLELYSVIPQAE